MNVAFIDSFQSEWLKTKRSLTFWMVIIGGFFTPAIIIVARLVNYDLTPEIYAHPEFWKLLWRSSWESMAVFFLPLGAILSTSLITQLEFKNNTWKQLHTLPLSLTTIFFSKLSVILLLMLQFFVLFNIGIFLAAVVPSLLVDGANFPAGPIPFGAFLNDNLIYFAGCLPIVALQYLISLRFKNFLVPVGAGFVFWVGSLAAVSWKFGYIVPYTYTILHYVGTAAEPKVAYPPVGIPILSLGYFALFIAAGYVMYLTNKEKG